MSKRKPMIAGNWKMHNTVPEAVETAERLVKLLEAPPEAEVMIAPTYVQLHAVSKALEGTLGKRQ